MVVVVISSISKGIEVRYGIVNSVFGLIGEVAPCVVGVREHLEAVAALDSDDIAEFLFIHKAYNKTKEDRNT